MARTDEERFKPQFIRLKREAEAKRLLEDERARENLMRNIEPIVVRTREFVRPAPIQRQRPTFVPQQPQIQQPKTRPKFFTFFSLEGPSPINLQGAYARAMRAPINPLW